MKKRIIYIDQFGFSNMMKEIDPAREGQASQHHAEFYKELFKQFDRLGKLLLIVCPRSNIHTNESVVSPDYEKIRTIFDHLSFGAHFEWYETIRARQVMAALNGWLRGDETLTTPHNSSEAIRGKIDVWIDRLRISSDLPADSEEISALKSARNQLQTNLETVVSRWRQDHGKKFDDWFEEEVTGHGNLLIEAFLKYIQYVTDVRSSRVRFDPFRYGPNFAADLMMQIIDRLKQAGIDRQHQLAKVKEFFASKMFREVPVVRIEAALWAGFAHRIYNGQKEWRPSIGNDIKVVSAYLPFCDAMFLDNECANLLMTAPVDKVVSHRARIFSIKTKNDFLAYLKDIEASASRDHLSKIQEVYGDDWATPFVEILKVCRS